MYPNRANWRKVEAREVVISYVYRTLSWSTKTRPHCKIGSSRQRPLGAGKMQYDQLWCIVV